MDRTTWEDLKAKWWAIYDLIADIAQILGGRGSLNLGSRGENFRSHITFPLPKECCCIRLYRQHLGGALFNRFAISSAQCGPDLRIRVRGNDPATHSKPS